MRQERSQLVQDFLTKNHIRDYHLQKIAGDASFRSYFRAFLPGGKSLIVMDAPPELEDIKSFALIADFLFNNGFSAPQILAKDYQNGFMLLEDLGDASYSKILADLSGARLLEQEKQIYKLALDTLLRLNQITPLPSLPTYDNESLLREVMLFVEWYLPFIAQKSVDAGQIKEFQSFWCELFKEIEKPTQMVLRDYHADNLLLLREREGYKKVGILDFQDAVIGWDAYDIVSLLEDARRDVSQKTSEEMLIYYLDHSACNQKSFLYKYSFFSLQRNIKIIGIFARLAVRDGKKNYLNLLPRVFGYVRMRSKVGFLKDIRNFIP